MKAIDPKELVLRPFGVLDDEWALLVGGVEKPNPMTVSWGGMGTLWNRPVVTVYVRPTRHTFHLLNAHPEFTLSFLPETYRGALQLCGARSGRDTDKWAAAGIGAQPSEKVRVPRVAEARLAFECRTLTTFDIDPDRFLEPALVHEYPHRDFHRAYIGQVVAALSR